MSILDLFKRSKKQLQRFDGTAWHDVADKKEPGLYRTVTIAKGKAPTFSKVEEVGNAVEV